MAPLQINDVSIFLIGIIVGGLLLAALAVSWLAKPLKKIIAIRLFLGIIAESVGILYSGLKAINKGLKTMARAIGLLKRARK